MFLDLFLLLFKGKYERDEGVFSVLGYLLILISFVGGWDLIGSYF